MNEQELEHILSLVEVMKRDVMVPETYTAGALVYRAVPALVAEVRRLRALGSG